MMSQIWIVVIQNDYCLSKALDCLTYCIVDNAGDEKYILGQEGTPEANHLGLVNQSPDTP